MVRKPIGSAERSQKERPDTCPVSFFLSSDRRVFGLKFQQTKTQAIQDKAGQCTSVQVTPRLVADDIPDMLIKVVAEIGQVVVQ